MTATDGVPRSAIIARRVARIWSILVTAGTLLMTLSPDTPGETGTISTEDWFGLGMIGVALLGLFIAWRWEFVGGVLTLAMMFIREITWVILHGKWFAGFLILWFLIASPAILFLVARRLERNAKAS